MPGHSFSLEQLVSELPRDEQLIVRRLRALITECIPKATEHMYDDWTFPFYRHNRLICFICPASISWERRNSSESPNKEGTALGFSQGNLMADEGSALLSEGRKQVYVMYFKSVADIDDNQVRALLFEAAIIDEEFAKKKKRK